jgi:Zn-dependent protease
MDDSMTGDDELDNIRLDEDFIRGGKYEPPARTRAAIAKYGSEASSWRQAAPLQPPSAALRRRRAPARAGHSARSQVRPSPIFLLTIALTAVFGALVWNGKIGRPGVFFFVLGGWMVSLCLHEYAHAFTGFHGGDHSVAARGYLRLDPRRYQHPFLSFVIPVVFFIVGGIGFPGGAVEIDRSSLRSRPWRSAVSLAGPATNAAFAAICLAPFALPQVGHPTIYRHVPFFLALALLAALQLMAVVLNLLPIPGLDGWGVIEPFLADDVAYTARKFATPALFIVMLVLMRVPTINRAIWYVPLHVADATGVPHGFVQAGWTLAKFWSTH